MSPLSATNGENVTSTLSHTTQGDWDNVLPGMWYGSVIIGRTLCPHTTEIYACAECSETTYGTETSSVYAYSNATEYAPEIESLVPEGWYLIEYERYLTPSGRHHMWQAGDRWAFENQEGPDAVEYDTYDAQMTL